ncbi:hypothetical protein HaLaN_25688 [Haematococcus lacustris]|uniref:Uncharacterized protein n=1 Tax=Haematococcus lacustris TaxID=44745 RepID=A0A6A0A2Z2_HAELA|nr:hypothetical protein HaLaN_25688 [Haematococcus lacustris]
MQTSHATRLTQHAVLGPVHMPQRDVCCAARALLALAQIAFQQLRSRCASSLAGHVAATPPHQQALTVRERVRLAQQAVLQASRADATSLPDATSTSSHSCQASRQQLQQVESGQRSLQQQEASLGSGVQRVQPLCSSSDEAVDVSGVMLGRAAQRRVGLVELPPAIDHALEAHVRGSGLSTKELRALLTHLQGRQGAVRLEAGRSAHAVLAAQAKAAAMAEGLGGRGGRWGMPGASTSPSCLLGDAQQAAAGQAPGLVGGQRDSTAEEGPGSPPWVEDQQAASQVHLGHTKQQAAGQAGGDGAPTLGLVAGVVNGRAVRQTSSAESKRSEVVRRLLMGAQRQRTKSGRLTKQALHAAQFAGPHDDMDLGPGASASWPHPYQPGSPAAIRAQQQEGEAQGGWGLLMSTCQAGSRAVDPAGVATGPAPPPEAGGPEPLAYQP